MKKLTFFLLMLVSIFTFSQGSIVEFDFQDGSPRNLDPLTDLKLPLQLHFTDEFKDLSVEFTDENAQILCLKNAKFGGIVSKNEDSSFTIFIDEDKTVNPSNPNDGKINADKFVLQIDQSKFHISLLQNAADSSPSPNSNGPKNEEEYIAGYLYYDAMKLTELLNNNSDDASIIEILKAYGVEVSNVVGNPYLNEVFGDFFSVSRPQGGAASSFLKNLGNTDVTYFAAGLARFLAERTKEELNEAFFSKMKAQLNAYPELMTVFPKTSSFLNTIETYSYATVIQVLKEAFETDIQNLPENLYDVKSLTSSNCNSNILKESKFADCEARLDSLKKFFESKDGRWIGLGMFTVKEAIHSSNPADLLISITASDEFTELKKFSEEKKMYADYNIASSIELSNFLSLSLISKDENQIWINFNELNALFKDPKAIKIYLGLLLAKEQKGDVLIQLYTDKDILMTFGNILIEAHKNYTILEPQITSLIKNTHSAFSSANNAVNKIIAATDKSVEADPRALYDYYRTFTASIRPIAHSTFLKAITRNDIGASYDKVEQFLNPSVDIAYDIATKKYSAAIYDAVVLLNNLNSPVFEKPVTKSFIKYGTLISTVASAQSSDEVKQALEASVLPVGSSAIKRNSNWSISVNAYVGGFYGRAYTHGIEYKYDSLKNPIDSSRVKKSYQTFGLYAPIGVSFSKGFKSGWGLSLTTQLIDLGALVNFYLINGDQTVLPSDFTNRLSNVFAPGAQLGINIPKTPLAFTGGFQYVPALSKSDQISTSSEIVASNAVRWQVGLVVDIPMYNIKVWDFDK